MKIRSMLICASLSLVALGRNFDAHELNRLVYPFWLSGQMDYESILLTRDNEQVSGSLLFTPKSTVKIWNYDFSAEYSFGKDFEVQGRQTIFPEDTIAPSLTPEQLYPPTKDGAVERVFPINGGFVLAPDGAWMHLRQVKASYQFDQSEWEGPRPGYKLDRLPCTKKMMEEKQSLNILFFGDSLTEGAHASRNRGVAPMLPGWDELVVYALKQQYGGPVEYLNAAIGGTTSEWGMKTVKELAENPPESFLFDERKRIDRTKKKLLAFQPDLAVIAFGMNGAFSAAEYRTHIEGIISAIRQHHSDAEFILIKSMLPNGCWKGQRLMKEYWGILDRIAESGERIITVDIGPVHEAILERKTYADLSSNHVNHPDDFLVRVYAQVILSSLIDFPKNETEFMQ